MMMKKDKTKINIVYKALNNVTGEVYIGATTQSIKKRKIDHIERANRGVNGRLQEAIGTYGPEAFTWTQIDTASTINELAQKEKEYIVKYKSKGEILNNDCGGGFKKTVYQYSLDDGSLINTYDCLTSAANAVNAAKQNISSACLGINKTCKGYIWSYTSTFPINFKDNRKKKVSQLDLDDNFIAEYASIAEASKATEINKSSIAKVCRQERKQAGSYKWKYI